MTSPRYAIAVALLQFSSLVLARGEEEPPANDQGSQLSSAQHGDFNHSSVSSYAGLDKASSVILAHIVLMVLAWFFVLPVGKSCERANTLFISEVDICQGSCSALRDLGTH